MQPVIIAIGSNVGNRLRHLREACVFLGELSEQPLHSSSIYLTEPVGPSERYFLNAVVEAATDLSANDLLQALKSYEQKDGRPANHDHWAPRTIDLDIISYNNLVIRQDNLIIPHPRYPDRLFVLEPLREIHPNWHDPKTGRPIDQMITHAPAQNWRKTKLTWSYGQ